MIRFGEADQAYMQYGLLQYPVLYSEKKTPYKAIVRGGDLIAIVRESYKLLPNEVALKVADNVAKLLRAERLSLHYDQNSTRLYSTYIFPDREEIVDHDTVHPGFTIKNSIDGRLAFSVTGFTYRTACKNGVILNYKSLTHFYRKHTKGLEIADDRITKVIQDILYQLDDVIKKYVALSQIKLNADAAREIAQLPKSWLPKYIEVEDGTLSTFDSTKRLWDVYNDITAQIWHGKGSMLKKNKKFDRLHRTIFPLVMKE